MKGTVAITSACGQAELAEKAVAVDQTADFSGTDGLKGTKRNTSASDRLPPSGLSLLHSQERTFHSQHDANRALSKIASIILGCGLVGKRTGLDAAHAGLLAILFDLSMHTTCAVAF